MLSLLCATAVYAFSQTADAADKDRDRSKYAVNNFAEDDKYTMLNPYETVTVQEPKGKKVKNIIFMIGDGMGYEQISAAWVCNGGHLNLDNFSKSGIQRTYSANKLVVVVKQFTNGCEILVWSLRVFKCSRLSYMLLVEYKRAVQ